MSVSYDGSMENEELGKGRRGQELKMVCAWCGKDMGEKDGEGIEGISHSICEECLTQLEEKSGEKD